MTHFLLLIKALAEVSVDNVAHFSVLGAATKHRVKVYGKDNPRKSSRDSSPAPVWGNQWHDVKQR